MLNPSLKPGMGQTFPEIVVAVAEKGIKKVFLIYLKQHVIPKYFRYNKKGEEKWKRINKLRKRKKRK